MNISFVRNQTGLLDPETIEGVLGRFQDFCNLCHLEENEESWKLFWKPVCYADFMALMGQKVIVDEEEVELDHPHYWDWDNKVDKMFGPDEVNFCSEPRFKGFSRPYQAPYPVDSDMKIMIAVKVESGSQSVEMSYNEVAGLSGGRTAHWTEPHTFKSEPPTHSGLASLFNNWMADPLYRQTPEGEPTVEDLIQKGSVVKSNYSSTEYIVEGVRKYEVKPIERPEDHVFEAYSLSLINRETKKGGFSMNELVSVGGRILGLFMSDQNEVFILGNADSIPTPVIEEEDDEDDSCCTIDYSVTSDEDSEPSKPMKKEPLTIKGVQLSLF